MTLSIDPELNRLTEEEKALYLEIGGAGLEGISKTELCGRGRTKRRETVESLKSRGFIVEGKKRGRLFLWTPGHFEKWRAVAQPPQPVRRRVTSADIYSEILKLRDDLSSLKDLVVPSIPKAAVSFYEFVKKLQKAYYALSGGRATRVEINVLKDSVCLEMKIDDATFSRFLEDCYHLFPRHVELSPARDEKEGLRIRGILYTYLTLLEPILK